MPQDPELIVHKQWLGLLQPVGLVVSPPALAQSQVFVNRDVVELQEYLRELVAPEPPETQQAIIDFPTFAVDLLGWEPEDLMPESELPENIAVPLPEYGETLKPTYGVPDPDGDGYLMLIKIWPVGENLDVVNPELENTQYWQASPEAKFERLLRETQIPVGLLCNGTHLRLVYAPRGESSGYLTFPVEAMCEISGRLILGAMDMLLCAERIFNAPEGRRLRDLLENSRQYQNDVSIKLADQVLGALWELLRGFQAADEMSGGKLLQGVAETDPQHLYGGLITTLLRLVFLLYAEDEGLMPQDSVYVGNYSVTKLFEKLRQDAGNYPDTMEQRYGSWAWLVSLFRLVYHGGGHIPQYLPARHGQLFDPDEYSFLEGRSQESGVRSQELGVRSNIDNSSKQDTGKIDNSSKQNTGKIDNSSKQDTRTNSPPLPHSPTPPLPRSPTPLLPLSPTPPLPYSQKLPRISDGVIFRVLNKLLIVDGDRLSYRSLDVEHIGSVYEAVMGYVVERATGSSIGIWSKPAGAKVSVTVVVNVEEILAAKVGDRSKILDSEAGCKLSGNSLKELKVAKTVSDVVAALGRRISPQTPGLMPKGSLYLQPTEERRRSGSHYTPRSMTEPLVKETLRPILARLGENPTPEQILDLKVCDLAMGSGAFLVETCRQLAEVLVKAWESYLPQALLERKELEGEPLEKGYLESEPLEKGYLESEQDARTNSPSLPHSPTPLLPKTPPLQKAPLLEEDEPLIKARRIIAQRCIYGVDKNPFAVNLAKLSLWLVTLAKNQPFTFVDHALKCGDSLVGLSQFQIANFTWLPQKQGAELGELFDYAVRENIDLAEVKRSEILALDDDNYDEKKRLNDEANNALEYPQFRSNLVIAAFFSEEKAKARKERLEELKNYLDLWKKNNQITPQMAEALQCLNEKDKAVKPLNWDAEFPEVFDRKNPGFDAIIGNPPFAGKNTALNAHVAGYMDWLKEVNPESHGNSDLVAHFFRRAFNLIRKNGTFGLIATNTIAQGDTRSTGLRFICENGGTIYHAIKRKKWEGAAAVVVSTINILKGKYSGGKLLDGKAVDRISAYLFYDGGNENPQTLLANANKSFQGSIIFGMGFTFDDTTDKATPISEMERLIKENPKNEEVIFPYIGGQEVNSSPTHAHHRYVINFGEMSEEEARKYPDLMSIVDDKVKPERLKQKDKIGKEKWWLFLRTRPEMQRAIAPLSRVLVCSLHSQYLSFAFLPANSVFSHALAVFANQEFSFFAIIQSGIHEVWARFFGSSLEDRLRYTPSDCFETFPFPENWESDPTLEKIGKTYYEYRAEIMVKNNQGLTETYNRFHDPLERHNDIIKLRQLHQEMDAAVLKAYGWQDIPTDCDFLLDYEEEEAEDSTSKKKKPWRYRWSESTHDEVLGRLLELNKQRYQEEVLGGKTAQKKTQKSKGGRKKKASQKDSASIPGFPEM